MTLKIRRSQDFSLVRKLHAGLGLEDVLDQDADWWIVTSNGTPVAYAGLKESARFANCGYLCYGGVAEKFQGRGIQKKLIRVRTREARRRGYEWLFTDTYRNPPSENSLIACGFKTYRPEDYYRSEHSTYWRLKLS